MSLTLQEVEQRRGLIKQTLDTNFKKLTTKNQG